MYSIVDRPPGEPFTRIERDGQHYPLPCVVEDEQGSRLLLIPEPAIGCLLWQWALACGAVAVVTVADGVWAATKEMFAERRTEQGALYVLAEQHWVGVPWGATAVDIHLAQRKAAEQRAERAVYERNDFVHLHTHSEFSSLDGLSRIQEIVDAVVRDGNPAVAITDHGNCAAHPALQAACDEAGIQPIFGMEAYFVDDVQVKERGYYHLCLWAMNDEGLRNLWALSTASYTEGFYYKPRVDWAMLERHSAGLIASTACLAGPVARPMLRGEPGVAEANLDRLHRIFGDRLYVELHANQLDEQISVNAALVKMAGVRGIPLIAVVDSHYAEATHKRDHKIWLSIQTNSDIADDTDLFGGDQDYHLLTRDEVAKSLAYLDDGVVVEAIANTVALAERCTARIVGEEHNPIFTRASAEHPTPQARQARDVERLYAACEERWAQRVHGKTHSWKVYRERFEQEMALLVPKHFSGYLLIVADIVNHAKKNRCLVGPGRGSAGGSLVAYLLGITEVDPVEYDLLFARFMTEGRVEPPDIDIDFPSTKKQFMLDYVAERWGPEHVATVGTHLRLKSKGVVRDVARAIKSTLPEDYYRDVDAVSAIIADAEAGTAGLGMAWDALWAEHAEVLQPFRDKYPRLFDYCDHLHGRLKTYGAHPAGVIIDPDNRIFDALPLRLGEGGQVVSQFDMNAITMLGKLKVDLLNLRTLDTLQQTLDLIFERTGRWVDVYAFDHELRDPQIFEEICEGWTEGVFQVETCVGTQMCKRLQPDSVLALADVITLVRPGPMRSGLSDLYLKRRAGDEEIYYADPRLESVLESSLGCMIYQEDVMATVMTLAGYSSTEADKVRKILGKKQVEKVLAEGHKFVAQAVERGMDRLAAEDVWSQMAEFAKYGFGKAHAVAYALLGFWTAWFKIHYPVEFLTATLSTVKAERIPAFVDEARRMGYAVLPPDINESGVGFTASQNAVRYGLESVKGLGPAAVAAILEAREEGRFASFEDFIERRGTKCNAGHVKILARIGAFDTLIPNRRALETRIELEELAAKGTDSCAWKGVREHPVAWLPKPLSAEAREGLVLLGGSDDPDCQQAYREQMATLTERTEWALPCDYPWVSEPDVLGRTGKPTKRKAPPKRCSRACRQFAPAPVPGCDDVEPYSDAEIRRIEMDVLGVYLSSTPFDEIPPELLDELVTGFDVQNSGPGLYLVAATIRSVRKTRDRNGNTMAFLSVDTPQGGLDLVCFSSLYELYADQLTEHTLVAMAVKKNDRGLQLQQLEPLLEDA